MKKALLTSLALTFMAAPIMTAVDASAQTRQENRQDNREDRRENRQENREDRRDARQDNREDRQDARQERREDRQEIRQGGRYLRGGSDVSDYRRYKLRAPGNGQRWVRYNNDFILVTISSGVIATIIAAQ